MRSSSDDTHSQMIHSLFAEPILGLETSCDETSAAVVVGTRVLSNVVSSQAELHRKWGGVVPEAAARAHVEALLPVLEEALERAEVQMADLRAIAVTNRPGLVGALSVGVSAAKALAFACRVPLLGVHHLEGHLLSVLAVEPFMPMPHTALIVSGGHTEIVLVEALGSYRILGQTLDDAAGEAFDKGARLLGLGYPGGRAIQDAAMAGDPTRYPLPRGLSGETTDFSFSGLKTAVLRLVEREGSRLSVADAAASLQEAIVAVLAERSVRAALASATSTLSLVGGVAANAALRERMSQACDREGIRFVTPPIDLCTDNAAMIALASSHRLARGERHGYDLEPQATSDLPASPEAP
jgi:N6-L-threonylcarbamoyladenine synthase